MHANSLSSREVAELKARVYSYMLSTRPDKYKEWVRGINRYRYLARLADRCLVPLGVSFFKDTALRVELIEAIYIAMRLIDDIVDKDAPLPEGVPSSVRCVERLLAFVESGIHSRDPIEALLGYAFDIGRNLDIDMKPCVRDILGSLHFDARSQEALQMQIFARAVLEQYFHLLDIRGTVCGCLAVIREPVEAWAMIEPLGQATRIRYNIRDLDEDMRVRLCNIPLEDVEEFGIGDVRDTNSPEMRRWVRKEAERGLDLLAAYHRGKKDIDLHIFTKSVLLRVYEKPAEEFLREVLSETARATL